MRMKNLTRIVALVFVISAAVTACGKTETDADLVMALRDAWVADDTFAMDLDVACLASGFIAGIGGTEGAREYGVTAANIGDSWFIENPLNETDALAASRKMFACGGLVEVILGGTNEFTAEQAACLRDEVSPEPLIAVFASAFMAEDGAELAARYQDEVRDAVRAAAVVCDLDP